MTVVRRDTRGKEAIPLAALAPAVEALLGEIQADLFRVAKQMLDERTAEVESFEELATRVATNAGWSLARWCGDGECEAWVKAETKATIRCIPRDLPTELGRCVV